MFYKEVNVLQTKVNVAPDQNKVDTVALFLLLIVILIEIKCDSLTESMCTELLYIFIVVKFFHILCVALC